MKFDTLYSKTKSGKVKAWDISVIPEELCSIVRISTGFVGKDKTIFDSVVSTGKNIGRGNETTHFSQAMLEAKSKWNKKKDSGYTEEESGEVDYVSPMLAVEYTERSHCIVFPCYIQPKLDGVRAVFYKGDLFSRKSKKFSNLDFLVDEIRQIPEILQLDGELYSDTLSFNELSGFLRKQKLTESDKEVMVKNIKFVVFDIVSQEDYSTRLSVLKKVFQDNKFNHLELVKTEIVESHEAIPSFHAKYTELSYEGLMIRNKEGGYLQKSRSKNLQKFKKFMDSEFEISGFTEGVGIESGLVLWILKVPGTDKTFTVRPTGTHAERKLQFKNASKYIGKMLTVKYFELFDGVPRFPIGLSVRDYE